MLVGDDLLEHICQVRVRPAEQPSYRHDVSVTAQPVRQPVHSHRPRLLISLMIRHVPEVAIFAPVQQPVPQRRLLLLLPRLRPATAAYIPAARSARYPDAARSVSIRFATTSWYSCGQCSGISVIGVDPCRANHCVCSSPAFIRRASTISNARSPNLNSGTLPAPRLAPPLRRHLAVRTGGKRPSPVPPAARSSASDSCMLHSRRVQPVPRWHPVPTHRRRLNGGQILRQPIQLSSELQRQVAAGRGNCSSLAPVNSYRSAHDSALTLAPSPPTGSPPFG